MVFEMPFDHPVCNWNISNDKFVFQERPDSSQIYLVHLFKEHQAILYQFNLPEHVLSGRTNTKYDMVLKKFVIPEENEYNMAQYS